MQRHFRSILGTLTMVTFLVPVVALAQAVTTQDGLIGIIKFFSTLLNSAVGLLVTAAIVGFFYGLVKYLFAKSSDDHSKALKTMGMGLLTIFVMVSVWGLIRLMRATLVGNDSGAPIDVMVPTVRVGPTLR